jgi:putative glutamine amidotransferase
LAEIVGLDEFPVNSSHHQAVDQLGEGLRVAARAPDGTVEAIELAALSTRFVVAVQWHPERIISHPPHLALFEAFIDACAQRAEPAKELSHVR